MQRDADVLVLGGGVIGLACAYWLRRTGRDVIVLEQDRLGAGASHGNCGTITPSHATPLAMPGMIGKALRWMLKADAPLYVKPRLDFELFAWLARFARQCNWSEFRRVTRIKAELLLRSREWLERLVRDERLECEFGARGTLYVHRDPRAWEAAQWLPRELAVVGVPIECWDGARARAQEPCLDESIVAAHFNPADAHLRPDRFVAELARLLRRDGVRIAESSAVEGFRAEAGRVASVYAGGVEWRPRDVVFALGAWSPALARELGLRLPIQPGKGYSLTYAPPALAPSIPLVLRERSVCVTAWSSGYRLGSTMEFSGYDSSLNQTRLGALERGAAEYLREPLGPRRLEEWFGWRPMTWDDLPIIGRSPRHSNLVLATGHGMLGVSLSAATGVLVSEIVGGKPTSLDVAPYALERFG
jgi:D-amino-acid dehydrogenase